MGTASAPYGDAIDHLHDGAALTFHGVSWMDYERLLEALSDRPRLRVSYDGGRLEIMTPLPEHEEYARFIDAFVRVCAERDRLPVQSYGGATWKRSAVAKGAEPDACYYVANAARVIGKRRLDPETDPPPDIVVEIDISNESVGKFSIYAALGVPEIWRYDGKAAWFYGLRSDEYCDTAPSASFPALTPRILADAIEQSKSQGQSAALDDFRRQWSGTTEG